MNLFNYNKSKNMIRLLGVFLAMGFVQPVWAAGPPAPSAFSNPLAIVLVVLMLLLLIVIGILANILIGTADVKLKKRKQQKAATPVAAVLITLLLLSSSSLFAQTGAAPADAAATTTAESNDRWHDRFYLLCHGDSDIPGIVYHHCTAYQYQIFTESRKG